MDQTTLPAAPRLYETFDPQTDLVEEEAFVTFLFYLPEFRKEQLKVQLSSSRVLRISGERPLGDNKWKRFVKEVGVPEVCDTKGIVAKFDGGILYVKQPKMVMVTPAAEPQPTTQLQPNPTPMPVPAPSNIPETETETEKMGEERRKETTAESAMEEQGESLGSGDAGNADFTNKTEEDEIEGSYGVGDEQGRVVRARGGQFEEMMLKKNLWNLLLIAMLVVALLLRVIYN